MKWMNQVVLLLIASSLVYAGDEGTKPQSRTTAPAVKSDAYVIGNDDVLVVSVWKEPELTRTMPVRPDGYIALPLIGEVKAQGSTPNQLQQELTQKLSNFITTPVVTVIVQEIRSQKVSVIGEVARPGTYPLIQPMTVMEALAQAGGFKDFAKTSKIYVLRVNKNGTTTKLPFDYKSALKGEGQRVLKLQTSDTIVVP